MTRALTPAARAAIYAPETGEVFLALAELTHPLWPAPVRVVNDYVPERAWSNDIRSGADIFEPGVDDDFVFAHEAGFTTVTCVTGAGVCDIRLDNAFEATLPSRRARVELRARPSLTGTAATTVTLSLRTAGGVSNGATTFSLSSGWQVLAFDVDVPANATDNSTAVRISGMIAGQSLDIDSLTVTRLPSLVSGGEVFTPLAFQVALPDDEDTNFPRAQFVADNTDLVLLRLMRQVQSPIAVTVRYVLASDPDAVMLEFAGEIVEVTSDAQTIRGAITPDPVMEMDWSKYAFTPTLFAALF